MKKMLAMLLIIAMLLPSLTTVLAESVEQSSVSPYLTNEETETEFIGTKTTAGEKCNVKFTPIKNTAELYGFSTYYEGGSAANWKGFVRFMSNTPEIVEFTNGYYESSFTAGDYIPSIDAIFAVKNLGASFALMRIDATTYAETEIKDYNTFYFMDMAFDRSSEVMYGVKGKTLYTIDLSNGNYTKIGNAGTPANIFTLACSDVGVLYAIDKTGSLYTLNKTSGEATLVGSTGVTLAYLQSMTWDHVNGGLYWANCNKNIGILYSLDPATAEATALGNIYGVNMEVTCLFTKGVWTGDPVPATGITVFPEEATLRTDKTLSLSAQIQPWNATEREISWTSSNPAIASVNENGFVRAITNGEATITATTVEGGFTDTCIITVPDNVQLAAEFDAAINAPGGNYHFTNDNAYPWEIVTLGERTAAKSTNAGVDGSQSFITTDPIHMYSGNTISFDWFTSCEEYYDLMFFAVNEDRIVSFSVESIDFANYVYEITAEGDYTFTWFYLKDIVGAAGEDCVYLDNVAIDAAPPGPITGVTLTPSTVDLYQTQTVQLAAALIPSSAFDIGVTFSSSNSNVATVDGSGLVTAVAPGTAFITVTTDDGGFTATSTINVTSTAELILKINAALNVGGGTLSFIMDSVNLWDTDATTFAGRNVAHSATNGKNQSSTVMTLVATTDGSKLITFDWMVSSEENYDKAVFSIDGVEKTRISGTHMTNFTTEVFNAGTAGEHTYTWVYIKDDSSGNGRDMVWLDNVTITETPAPQRVDMDVTAKVHLGQTIKVNATIVPSYATDMTLTYSTSDATKVTVDSNGFITGVGEGTATVTATAVNGVYAYCIVTVFNTIPASDGKLYGFVSSPGGITDGLTGFVSINPSTATAETIFDYSDEIFAAEYYNGVIYAFNNTTTEFLTFDAITGELLSHVSVSEVAYDMTYDYTTNTMYALFGIEDRGLATVNLATGELTHIGVMPTISPLITLAADNLGKLYGVAILTGIL
ncbi:MAG: Ig-like domain-containing protein, partial [Clostridia bacterium]